MKHSMDSHAGYLLIDHSNSPGLTAADVAHLPPEHRPPVVGAGMIYERDFKICSHCQATVVLNPQRVRDRAVCHHCHHYICDGCAAGLAMTGICVPFAQVLDRAQALTEYYIGQLDHPGFQIGLALLTAPPAPRVVVPGSPLV